WMKLIEMMTIVPARVAGLNTGTLADGADGDVTIIDPNKEWTVDVEEFKSRSRNCPFGGWKLKGRATRTIVGGDVKWEI
ncbi:MAG TPA: amidohydrolase family protein, partial [Tepidisphaeraceae bacterium]|nr:amidohydrolase family protein [Tepidisphaeraceae bacterium]